jgi:hypothetical protein
MTGDDPGKPHAGIHVHGGSGCDDVKAWLAKAEATGTYPRTLEHAHPGSSNSRRLGWRMEPWPGSPGDALTASQQVGLLRDVDGPDGIDIYDTAAKIPADRRIKIDHLVNERGENLSDMTGLDDQAADSSDFTIALFGEFGDGLLATFIGFHTAQGSVRHLAPLTSPND